MESLIYFADLKLGSPERLKEQGITEEDMKEFLDYLENDFYEEIKTARR